MTRDIINQAIKLHCQIPSYKEIAGELTEVYAFNNNLSEVAVVDQLLTQHTEDRISDAVKEQILATGEREWACVRPSNRETFKTILCFRLATEDDRLSIDADIAELAVRRYASVGWCQVIGPLVRRRLCDQQLLQALAKGIEEAPSSWQAESCLVGLSLYAPYLDHHCSALENARAIQAFETALHGTSLSFDASSIDVVQQTLDAFRRGPCKPELELHNYELRQERGQNPTIVDKATHKVVLEVCHYEIQGHTLEIRYVPSSGFFREDRARTLLKELLIRPQSQIPKNTNLEWIRYSTVRGKDQAVRRYPKVAPAP